MSTGGGVTPERSEGSISMGSEMLNAAKHDNAVRFHQI